MLQQRCHSSTIISKFCNVKLSDLRCMNKGHYAGAFIKHKYRDRMEVVRGEEALGKAAGPHRRREGKMEEALSDYQVFINHRGPDTKNNLASLFYEQLLRSGLRVFLDREELQTGNSVSPEIKAAIICSSVQIAIFSPRYAESPWCLEELCLMLEQRQQRTGITIIPIFCDVKPSNLRRVSEGPYAEAFTKHKDRGRMEVERWKEALKNAADIKGHEFHMREGDFGKFVFKILDIVLEKVRKEPLLVTEHPAGLDKAAENLFNEISKQMNPSGATTIVGIAGLGGSGKTTLVTHLYNLKHTLFKRSSFLYDVCKKTSELTSLQKQLLYELRFCSPPIWSPQQGMGLLRCRLGKLSRVLIVLDGIDSQEQIDSLLTPVKDVLVDGSLIVITSRDKHLLACCQVSFLYNMELLDEKNARKLFCCHAFGTSEAPTEFEDLVREMVKMCGGYPLALRDLGALLSGKRKCHWKLQLTNLQKNQFPQEMVEKIVKASYDSLEEKMKEVFLDVASFFEGLDSHLVVRFEGEVECPLFDWIETLGQKCLVIFHCVEVDVHDPIKYNDGSHDVIRPLKRRRLITSTPYRDCKIGMHKLVVDMAKKIASEERSLCLRCSENEMISSDNRLSEWQDYYVSWFQQMLEGPSPHLIIQNCCSLKGFRDLKYRVAKAFYPEDTKEYYHSEVLGLKSIPRAEISVSWNNLFISSPKAETSDSSWEDLFISNPRAETSYWEDLFLINPRAETSDSRWEDLFISNPRAETSYWEDLFKSNPRVETFDSSWEALFISNPGTQTCYWEPEELFRLNRIDLYLAISITETSDSNREDLREILFTSNPSVETSYWEDLLKNENLIPTYQIFLKDEQDDDDDEDMLNVSMYLNDYV